MAGSHRTSLQPGPMRTKTRSDLGYDPGLRGGGSQLACEHSADMLDFGAEKLKTGQYAHRLTAAKCLFSDRLGERARL